MGENSVLMCILMLYRVVISDMIGMLCGWGISMAVIDTQ